MRQAFDKEALAWIIESAMDAIITVDGSQRVVLFNAAAEKMFGCSAEEALGQPLDRFIPDRFRRAHQQHIEEFGQTQVTKRSMGALGAVYGLRASGEEFPVEASISHIEANGQKLFTVILRDITERRRAEEKLIEQAALLNYAQDAILVRGLDDHILFWNKGAERIYGWTAEEATGRDIKELIYRGDFSQFEEAKRAVIEQGEWSGELRQTASAPSRESEQTRRTSRWQSLPSPSALAPAVREIARRTARSAIKSPAQKRQTKSNARTGRCRIENPSGMRRA